MPAVFKSTAADLIEVVGLRVGGAGAGGGVVGEEDYAVGG